jgi:putative phosphoesterase
MKMKILLISDSHHYNDIFQSALDFHQNDVDLKVCCGDTSLTVEDPLIKSFDYVVKGNHDWDNFPNYTVFQNICLTHGNLYHVYRGYEELIELCQKENCLLCFHGHTHVPTIQRHRNITFINPGSLMMNRGSYGYGTYAIVDITNEIHVTYYHHMTHQPCPDNILIEGRKLLEEFKKII